MDVISVIIPVYNVEAYIDACLESVVKQTYQNLEIIVVDDGSTDGSSGKCDLWKQRDARIIVIHQENHGLSHARNTAIDLCTGAYIICLDPDDFWPPGLCEFVHAQMVLHNADMAVFKNLKFTDGEEVREKLCVRPDPFVTYDKMDAYRRLYGADQDFISLAHNKMYRRHMFREIRYPVGRRYEDASVCCHLIEQADKIIKSEEPLYYYRKRAGSIMDTTKQNHMRDLQLLDYRRERIAFFDRMKHPELRRLAYADYYYWLIRLSRAFDAVGQKDISHSLHREFIESYHSVKNTLSFGWKRRLKYFLFCYFRI